MYFTLDLGHTIAKCQKNKEWDIRTRNSSRLFASFGLTNTMASPGAGKVRWCLKADRMIDRYRDLFKFLSALQIKYFRKKLIFYEIQRVHVR